ncbi:T9SS type A sorting domain-containing protein [Halpernia sp. GG3]
MKKLYSLIAIAMFSFATMAQTTIAEWAPNSTNTPGGAGNYGPSPFTPTTADVNLTVGGLTRGSGILTATGTGAVSAWGGTDYLSADPASAITANDFDTFTISANSNYKVSISGINKYNVRRSSNGPTSAQWQYQVGSGSFINIGSTITLGSITSSAGNEQAAIDLSGISDLQNIAAGTTVTFRVLIWGASATTGTGYLINGNSAATSKTLAFVGTVVNTTLSVSDLNSSKVSLVKNTSVKESLQFGSKSDIQIINMTGQVVQKASVDENTVLNVSTLNKGIYIVTGVVNGAKISQKIIKD